MTIERKEIAEASEPQYRLLFERNPHPMWVYDLESLAFLAVNDAAIHDYGYSREDFLAMTIRDIRTPEDVPALQQVVAEVSPGLRWRGTWRHRKKDGTLIDVEIVSDAISFGGRSARLVLANDVSERKRAEAATRALAELGRTVAESLEVEEVGQRIADSVRTLVGAVSALLFGVDPKSGDRVLLALSGETGPGFARKQAYPWDSGATGLALRERRPVVTPDVLSDRRITLVPDARRASKRPPTASSSPFPC